MEEEKLTESDLANCTGTMSYHKLSMGKFNCTDGVKILATKGKAFWLIDLIASYQIHKEVKEMPFQTWKLKVNGTKGVVELSDGNDNVMKHQDIPYTDFPLEEVTLYLTDNVLLLPSEY